MTSVKSATSFLAVVFIFCFSRPPQTFAADETASAAISSKSEASRGSAENHHLSENGAQHQISIRAVPLSHKFTGLGKRTSTSSGAAAIDTPVQQEAEVGADVDKRALPSSLRFTGLGKRRSGVGAAMRYAGLGKRLPELPGYIQDGLAPEVDYNDAMPEAVAGLLDRRRRFAVNEFDDIVTADDVDGNQFLYELPQDFPATKSMIRGNRYSGTGKRSKPLVKISSRIDPGMRYMGIGKRDGGY